MVPVHQPIWNEALRKTLFARAIHLESRDGCIIVRSNAVLIIMSSERKWTVEETWPGREKLHTDNAG